MSEEADAIISLLDQLPSEMQDAIKEFDLNGAIENIAEQFALNGDQEEIIAKEFLIVLLNGEPVTELKQNLERELQVDSSDASALDDAFVNQILDPIMTAAESKGLRWS